jgi:hypothetical protein
VPLGTELGDTDIITCEIVAAAVAVNVTYATVVLPVESLVFSERVLSCNAGTEFAAVVL